MDKATRFRRWEALGEAFATFAFIMLYAWKLRPLCPWLAILVPAFTVATHVARGESARRLGFGWEDFRTAFPALLPWVVAAAGLLLAAGAAAGTIRPLAPRQIVGGVGAYMVWGACQQYLLNAFLANRLAEWAGGPERRTVPLAAAALFSLPHLPNWFLMAVTFAGGYLSVRVWQRYRSLYVLGIAHGVIAFVLFAVVPDSIGGHFFIGPRYLMNHGGANPEWLP